MIILLSFIVSIFVLFSYIRYYLFLNDKNYIIGNVHIIALLHVLVFLVKVDLNRITWVCYTVISVIYIICSLLDFWNITIQLIKED